MSGVDRLVGSRVALRYRVGERHGRPLYSDAVGRLARGAPGELLVTTRRGLVRVREDAVVAVRAVPPAVPRRPSWAAVAALEAGYADAWPAPVDDPLGGWRLRVAPLRVAARDIGPPPGPVGLALATGDPGMPIPAALRAVQEFAAAHGVPPVARVATGSPWAAALAAAGWSDDRGGGAVLVADLDVLPPPAPRFAPSPGPAAAVVREHLHVSLFGAEAEAPELIAAAARWGRARGARWAVLQVGDDHPDTAGPEAHSGLAFRRHHGVRYLAPRIAGAS